MITKVLDLLIEDEYYGVSHRVETQKENTNVYATGSSWYIKSRDHGGKNERRI